ncbi:hypothetical protein HD806DRAFT_68626 [Xylariaceae sp. AK1471]|nr:hypothetical protein HD806DRAFT_68626 [Xylariaceae sp. AK1471]
MSEYWKSTPKYWCKHCSTYVRDTKLERTNHENTAKHQSGLKRFLRDLHRDHENELREKDRAKREIDRLNGVVNPSFSTPSSSSSSTNNKTTTTATTAQRQQQWEQLAEMGIDVPTELRRDMAMAGEWTVTNTRIIEHAPAATKDAVDSKPDDFSARKRPKTEDEDDKEEEEEKVHALFKKPRKWGRDTKRAVEDDAELDALLSTSLTKPFKKEEEDVERPAVKGEESANIKKEEPETSEPLSSTTHPHPVANEQDVAATVKRENDQEPETLAVVFKKRKPKNLRQK